MDHVLAALQSVLQWEVLLTILCAAAYGLLVGAIPGLTATMAIALMVPVTFYLSDVQAVAAIVAAVTCSIFAGDIPSALVRIPGTPASAAYAQDAYALTQQGKHRRALGLSLVFSVAGGILGTIVLVGAAPLLALLAKQFTSYEYFWLYCLGLLCAAIVSDRGFWLSCIALCAGLLLSTVGLATDFSTPRFTFGFDEFINGISFIPAMIGLFGISEVLRLAISPVEQPASKPVLEESGAGAMDEAEGLGGTLVRRKWSLLRSSGIGSIIGMLPGAGADIAAWIAYAASKRFSSTPEVYGQGSEEGIADAAGANNAALGGAWIPALVFGIPGDSVTAIALGVLMMKDISPGPEIFTDASSGTLVMSIYVTFFLANLVLLPLGWLAIRAGSLLVRVPRISLVPAITLFCIVGSYAIAGSYVDVWIMLAMGLVGFAFERVGLPLAPVVLGLILGGPLEHRFIQCISVDASPGAFLSRPICLFLAGTCLAIVVGRIQVWRRARRA